MPVKHDEAFMREFQERLATALGGRTAVSLSRELGLSDSAVTNYLNGRNLPSLSVLASMAEALGVTTDYLLTGRQSASVPYDREGLRDVVEIVAEHLEREGLRPTPAKLAELVTLIYEMVMEDEEHAEDVKGKILQFVRLAS